jgi:hypothetical protein
MSLDELLLSTATVAGPDFRNTLSARIQPPGSTFMRS